jgi:hypothetical protein
MNAKIHDAATKPKLQKFADVFKQPGPGADNKGKTRNLSLTD